MNTVVNFKELAQTFISASSCDPFIALYFFRALSLTVQFPKRTALTLQRLLFLTDVRVQFCCCRQSEQGNYFKGPLIQITLVWDVTAYRLTDMYWRDRLLP